MIDAKAIVGFAWKHAGHDTRITPDVTLKGVFVRMVCIDCACGMILADHDAPPVDRASLPVERWAVDADDVRPDEEPAS